VYKELGVGFIFIGCTHKEHDMEIFVDVDMIRCVAYKRRKTTRRKHRKKKASTHIALHAHDIDVCVWKKTCDDDDAYCIPSQSAQSPI
jgi:hypothetical protein